MRFNFILATDSYKLTHANMLSPMTQHVFSYLEAREGGKFTGTLFVGLQAILLKYFDGKVITQADIDEAALVAKAHFGKDGVFNRKGWEYILHKYDGRLPIRIRAVAEGTAVPEGNVLVTIENLDPAVPWLTNAVESLLMHVWYPTTVATLSAAAKQFLGTKCVQSGGARTDANFMLHDFGYRGTSSHESAGIGGFGHLANFYGTDTLEAMRVAHELYFTPYDDIAYSVVASEHSVMTQNGPEGEHGIARDIIRQNPNGIVSMVADSYNYYKMVDMLIREELLIKGQKVKLVIRPDSVTPDHPTPESLVVWTLERVWAKTKGASKQGVDGKEYKMLPDHYRVLWGDGIDFAGIQKIVNSAMEAGFAPQNLVFGMGGGLLQKVNRDTCRFAIKCSAAKEFGVEHWKPVQKNPLGGNKSSKAGRLTLISTRHGLLTTIDTDTTPVTSDDTDLLTTVFEHGRTLNTTTLADIRRRAAKNDFPILVKESVES